VTDPATPTPAANRRRSRRLLAPAIAVVGLAIAGAFFAAGLAARANSGHTATSAPENYGPSPTYRLVDQNGQPVSSREFAGKVQVVSFLFPYCTSYCPLIARTTAELADSIAAGPLRDKVQLVTFNVDPAGASPAVLHRYIAQYGGHPDDPVWRYLTGTPAQIRQTVTGGFHIFFNKVSLRYEQKQLAKQERQAARQALTQPSPQPYTPPPHEPNPLATQAHVNYDVTHNDYVEIINRSGDIVAVFDQASTLTREQLLTAVNDALAGRPIPLQQVP
jgi:cytochrome oxidase Cu insertion factor (SCO1/SenC/PrrC family)